MNDEDVGRAGGDTGDINKVDVVFGEGHDGVIVAPVRRRLDVVPGERSAISRN